MQDSQRPSDDSRRSIDPGTQREQPLGSRRQEDIETLPPSVPPQDFPRTSERGPSRFIGVEAAEPTVPQARPASVPGGHDAVPLDADNASQAWDLVSQQIEKLVAAWERGSRSQAPVLAEFLPDGPTALRCLTLIELIKVDLLYRRQRSEPHLRLEDYLAQFPELSASGQIPYDLIYEEYYVRRQSGEAVAPQEYFERFPQQASELARLLEFEQDPQVSTALVSRERIADVQAGDKLDDFDLLARVGKGAFATVFLARQRSMQRMVALKVSADRGNEPQTMAQLDHPHIVRVFDQRLLADRKLRLLYMQYIPGGTLQPVVEQVRQTHSTLRSGKILFDAIDRSLVDRGEAPPPDSRLRQRLSEARWPEVVCWLGARLAAALDYAHQRGVLHRDLKPANVLVTADGSPKLVDFNISFCSKVEGATPAAYFGGSLAYMSPEQLEAFNPAHPRKADEMDARSDVYSLGVLLWELLTGSRPFRDEQLGGDWSRTLAAMAETRRAGVDAAALRQLPADCPPGLNQVLLKCLAPEPADRFATAGQLARQLELCLQPQVQRLLRPPAGGWRSLAQRFSIATLILAGLIPNAAASGLNIAYNFVEIIQPKGELAREVFFVQLLTVNPVAYSLGIGLLMVLCWPVLRAVLTRRRQPASQADTPSWVRQRALRLGEMVAWVSAAEWAVSGVIFPLWQHLHTVPMAQKDWLHFILSQVLCGLMAASLSFFLVTFLNVRAFYPLLAEPDEDHPGEVSLLRRLGARTSIYFLLAVSVPLVALFAVVLLADAREDRVAILVLGGVGLAAFYLAYHLSKQINQDISALAVAATPGYDPLVAATSDTVDSFWTASR